MLWRSAGKGSFFPSEVVYWVRLLWLFKSTSTPYDLKTCEVVVGRFAPKLEAIGLQGWVRYKADELRDTLYVTRLCCFWDLCWNFHLALHYMGWELWGEGGNVRGHWLRFFSLFLWCFGTMDSASLQLWQYQHHPGMSTQEGVRAEVSSMVVCWDYAASKTVCPSQNTVASSCLATFYCGHAKVQRLLSEHLFPPGLSFWQAIVSLLCTPHKEAALPLLT